MDVLVGEDGKEYILEVNSSSIGFPARHAAEDCSYIVDLCLEKIQKVFKIEIPLNPIIKENESKTNEKSDKKEKKDKKDKKIKKMKSTK